jgi:hypothetical protein
MNDTNNPESSTQASGVIITLACFHCRATKDVIVPALPQFAYEVAGAAKDVGWFGALDMRYRRTLVFCSEEHADKERTKAGYYRLRPKGPAELEQNDDSANSETVAEAAAAT